MDLSHMHCYYYIIYVAGGTYSALVMTIQCLKAHSIVNNTRRVSLLNIHIPDVNG